MPIDFTNKDFPFDIFHEAKIQLIFQKPK